MGSQDYKDIKRWESHQRMRDAMISVKSEDVKMDEPQDGGDWKEYKAFETAVKKICEKHGFKCWIYNHTTDMVKVQLSELSRVLEGEKDD